MTFFIPAPTRNRHISSLRHTPPLSAHAFGGVSDYQDSLVLISLVSHCRLPIHAMYYQRAARVFFALLLPILLSPADKADDQIGL